MKELLDEQVIHEFLSFLSALEQRDITVRNITLERLTKRDAGKLFGIPITERFTERFDIVERTA